MVFFARETGSVCPDWMVELRGFEPLTSAVPASARLTGSSLPFVGDVGAQLVVQT
jgi:hypothetical protein